MTSAASALSSVARAIAERAELRRRVDGGLEGSCPLHASRLPLEAAFVGGRLGFTGCEHAPAEIIGSSLTLDAEDAHLDDPMAFAAALVEAAAPPIRRDRGERHEHDRTPQLVRLADVKPERIDRVFGGRLARGKVAFIDGDPGLGKSLVVTDIAARVSTGEQMPDDTPGITGGVVILSAEDGVADTIVPRLLAAGADLERIVALETVGSGGDERLIALPDDLAALDTAIAAVDAALVIIDPLMAFLASEINSHRDQDVRRALAQLKGLAERTSVIVVIIRHLNKSSGGKAIYRGGGSIGLTGAARSVMLVEKNPSNPDERVIASIKNNLTREPRSLVYAIDTAANGVPFVSWRGVSDFTADALLANPPPLTDISPERQAAREFVLSMMELAPIKASAVADQADKLGVSDRQLRNARLDLGIVTRPEYQEGKRGITDWWWQWPSDGPADHPEGDRLNESPAISGNSTGRVNRTADRLNDGARSSISEPVSTEESNIARFRRSPSESERLDESTGSPDPPPRDDIDEGALL